MTKVGISFEEMKADMLKDEEFKAEYDKLRPSITHIKSSYVWLAYFPDTTASQAST